MMLAMQAQLAAQARTIGVPRRTLKHRRVHRPHLRTVAVAAVEPDVQEPQQAVAAAEPQQEGAAGGAAEPQQQQQRQQRGNQRRGFNQRPKKVLGPARTIQTADVETGKWYDGTVVSVMEFGAFVNIGAATDGLLHISQISAGFVKRVADVVKVGDEVKVRVVNVDQERGKFAVSMINPDQKPEEGEQQQQQQQRRQQGGGSATEGEPRERFTIKQARREKTPRRARKSPVNKGDTLTAKVVSVSSFGAFVDVGEGMTGLLHETEVVLPEGATAWQEVVKEGQEVTVHVVGVQGEKIQLSMRSKEESEAHSALMADGAQSAAPEGAGTLGHALAAAGISAKLFKARNGSAPPASVPDAAEEAPAAPAAAVEEKVEEPAAHAVAEEEKAEQPAVPAVAEEKAEEPAVAAVAEEKAEEPAAPAVAEVETAEEPAVPAVEEEKAEEAAVPAAAAAAPAAPAASVAPAKEEKPAAKAAGGISAALVKQLRETSGAGMMDCKKALAECNGDLDKAKEYLRKKGLASADKKAGRVAAEGMVWSYIHAGSRLGVLVEVNCETDFVARGDKFQELVNDMAMQIAACPEVTVVSVEEVPAEVLERERAIEMEKEDILSKPEAIRPKIVQGRVDKIAKTMALLEQPFVKDSGKTVAEVVKEAVAAIGENIQIRRFAKYTLGEGIEKATADLAADVEAQTKAMQAEAEKKKEKKEEDAPKAEPAAAAKPAVAVSAAVVKQLREKTGAGMMDCKKALGECEGDVEKATEYLRKKGLASADKKSGRVAAEGAIGAYIHSGSRLGVLVEVNCETDFVARGEKFRELVNDMAMQIAACADVRFVSAADVPAEVLERERAIEMEKEDLKSKPEAIRAKIVQGRVDKIAKEMALLEQAFVRDSAKTVAEHIKEQIAAIGENIQVRRFERFVLGEGIEKKVADFAAEVAAQTGAQL